MFFMLDAVIFFFSIWEFSREFGGKKKKTLKQILDAGSSIRVEEVVGLGSSILRVLFCLGPCV